ncbi:MAG: flagellar hook capping FlgD N-terminal domain-containing protein, partial [Oscillospiraceae bacterium]
MNTNALNGYGGYIPPAANKGMTQAQQEQAKVNEGGKSGKTDDKKTGNNATKNLQVNDFLKLLASQLQNQDMMNPMKDTEFMSQLAQFTMLQSVDDMKAYVTNSAEVNATSYAMSLVGKTATAATLDKDGKMEKITGEITG